MDSHSKWLEVDIMASTTTEKTIEVLRAHFARFGLPKQLVTDNGPQFTSKKFVDFLAANGIQHARRPRTGQLKGLYRPLSRPYERGTEMKEPYSRNCLGS